MIFQDHTEPISIVPMACADGVRIEVRYSSSETIAAPFLDLSESSNIHGDFKRLLTGIEEKLGGKLEAGEVADASRSFLIAQLHLGYPVKGLSLRNALAAQGAARRRTA